MTYEEKVPYFWRIVPGLTRWEDDRQSARYLTITEEQDRTGGPRYRCAPTQVPRPDDILQEDSDTEIFPDAIGLFFVRLTFLSRSLSTISLKIHPALLIKTEPKKNKIICFKYKSVLSLK